MNWWRWWWRRWHPVPVGEPDDEAAANAAAHAQEQLEQARRRRVEVAEVYGGLREFRERNHFAEMLAAQFGEHR